MDDSPIRLVSPIQIPGAGPMEVRHPLRRNFVYNIGGLAANATYTSPPIDLSLPENVAATWIMAHKYGAPSTGQVLTLQWSPNGTNWYHMPQAGGAQGFAWANGDSAYELCVQGRPMFGLARVVYRNGSTVQANLKIHVTLISGV